MSFGKHPSKFAGSGQVFVWGENGLEPAAAPQSDFRQPLAELSVPDDLPAEAVCPFSPDDFESVQRERPKTLPRRQRSTFSEEDDFCNDPEELERRARERRDARKKGTQRQTLGLFGRGLDALARRDYSRKDLEQKLRRSMKEGETEEGVQTALNRLEASGFLSDARFAESRARIRSSGMGNARIRRELQMAGVGSDDVETAIEAIAEPEEFRAQRLWERRFKARATERKERERQIRYLLYRGFSMNVIQKVLRGDVVLPETDDSVWH